MQGYVLCVSCGHDCLTGLSRPAKSQGGFSRG